MSIHRRLDHIEAQLAVSPAKVPWAAVDMAMRREQARARIKMCDLLGVDLADPRAAEAAAVLSDDSPAVHAQDAAILAAWRRQEGLVDRTEGARARLRETIDQIAERLAATP